MLVATLQSPIFWVLCIIAIYLGNAERDRQRDRKERNNKKTGGDS